MAYDTPRSIHSIFCTATTTQTYTASGQALTVAATEKLNLPEPCQVVDGVVECVAAGQASGYSLNVLAGTTTIGSIPIVNTAGSVGSPLSVTVPDVYNTQVTFSIKGTGTASAAETNPTVKVILGLQSRFV